jgi:hypothetical protein
LYARHNWVHSCAKTCFLPLESSHATCEDRKQADEQRKL